MKKNDESLFHIATSDFIAHIQDEDEAPISSFALSNAVAKRSRQINDATLAKTRAEVAKVPKEALTKEEYREQCAKIRKKYLKNFNPVKEATKEFYDGKTKIVADD